MKSTTILILLLISKLSFSYELVRLTESQRYILNLNFKKETSLVLERLGSGDIVGNGGGLIEQNFMSAYYSVQTAIQNCLNNYECAIDDQEKLLLKEIENTYIQKIDQVRPLIFVNKSVGHDFFKSSDDQTERIAKTGFTKEDQIFINLDMAKSIENDIPAMLSILIHELGHQVGIANHSALDQIGAKVRNQWNSSWKVLSFKMEKQSLDVRLFSTDINYLNSKLSYTFNNETKSLNKDIFEKLSCSDNNSVYGFSLSNGHWERPVEDHYSLKIGIDYWIDIYCIDEFGTIETIKKDLDITFRFSTFNRNRQKLRYVKLKVK